MLSKLRFVLMVTILVALSIVDWAICVVLFPLFAFLDPKGKVAHRINGLVTWATTSPVISLRVKGVENLPTDHPFVLAPNHQSLLDAFIFYPIFHSHEFRCMYKREIAFYPIIGQLFWFARNIMVNRSSRSSGHSARLAAVESIRRDVSVLFFPEGTRRINFGHGAVGPYKAGAFKTAVETGSPIVPVSISGVRAVLPLSRWSVGTQDVELTFHKPIATDNIDPNDRDAISALMERSRATTLAALRPCDYYAGKTWDDHREQFMAAWTGPESWVAANAAVGITVEPVEEAVESQQTPAASTDAGGVRQRNT